MLTVIWWQRHRQHSKTHLTRHTLITGGRLASWIVPWVSAFDCRPSCWCHISLLFYCTMPGSHAGKARPNAREMPIPFRGPRPPFGPNQPAKSLFPLPEPFRLFRMQTLGRLVKVWLCVKVGVCVRCMQGRPVWAPITTLARLLSVCFARV
ncbi:hypothetical protein B0T11DRAFT_52996 [Plectosphaerella cucumerina]|uniref:Uncharacterized protein n=1 Tax=Plectosphaerella cucumerina TaxID=40658 RepID=A0A8K0TKP5_9PEZI|nr:hypothetical protein B0T11DRAFT_52996 [Plectosphaerella cucumerina]